MSTVTAIYKNGVFRPLAKVDLPEETHVEVSLPETSDLTPEAGHRSVDESASRRAKCEEWMRELDEIRARGWTGKVGVPLQEILDDIR